jgi:hypothetical protein
MERLAGHPLAPFFAVPQLPSVDYGLGTTLEPAPGMGLHMIRVLAAPRSNIAIGWATDLSA